MNILFIKCSVILHLITVSVPEYPKFLHHCLFQLYLCSVEAICDQN